MVQMCGDVNVIRQMHQAHVSSKNRLYLLKGTVFHRKGSEILLVVQLAQLL